MARIKKPVEVQKFGGTEHLGETQMHGYSHEIESIEAQSKTTLDADKGIGEAAVIRCFEFKANPEVFEQKVPSKQELFNYHHKGIEIALWRDGLVAMPEVNPRIVITNNKYQIFVGARPMRGQILQDKTQTLTEIANG